VATLDGIDISAPTTAKRIVFVTVEDPGSSRRITLYAINTADGQVRWKLGSDTNSSLPDLVIVGNTIYFSTDKSLIAAELETGRQLWSFSADGIKTWADGIKSWTVQADDQHLYVSTSKGSKHTLHALALATGQQKWSQDGYWLSKTKMVHGGTVYGERSVGTIYLKLPGSLYGQQWTLRAASLHAFDAASGRKLWSTKLPHASPELISGGRIFLSSDTDTTFGLGRVDKGYLYAINARTGKLRP
jgi:outer membrane protein assembly factor BamB